MNKYIMLLKNFVYRKISADEFERRFLELFKGETALMPEREFHILDKLFGDVDAYCNDPDLIDPQFDIDENELRSSAQEALAELGELIET